MSLTLRDEIGQQSEQSDPEDNDDEMGESQNLISSSNEQSKPILEGGAGDEARPP